MLAGFYQEENHQSNIELSCYTAVSADIQDLSASNYPRSIIQFMSGAKSGKINEK